MPASILGELILQPILELIFYILGYHVGRIVVFVFTLGRIKCDRFLADTSRRKKQWGGTYHRRGQQIYLTAEATAAVGVIFLVLTIGVGFLIWIVLCESQAPTGIS